MRIILKIIAGGEKDAWLLIVKYLEKNYNFIVIDSIKELRYYYKQPIETILIPYSFNVCSNLKSKELFLNYYIKEETKFYRLFNEYNLSEMSFIGKAIEQKGGAHYIVNYEKINKKNVLSWNIINLNCILFEPLEIETKKRIPEIIYWGTFRTYRQKYFNEYLSEVILSTSKKSHSKFYLNGINAKRIIKPINITSHNNILTQFGFSLYIEDTKTHTNYNFPANRFYESLKYGLVQLFDINCKNTFDKYGLDISRYIISNKEELKEKICKMNYQDEWKIQKEWRDLVLRDIKETNKKLTELFPNE